MLLEEVDFDKYERTLKNEGKEEGIEIGMERGKIEGRKEGEERISMLIILLMEQNRTEDLKRLKDAAYRKKLFQEFNL